MDSNNALYQSTTRAGTITKTSPLSYSADQVGWLGTRNVRQDENNKSLHKHSDHTFETSVSRPPIHDRKTDVGLSFTPAANTSIQWHPNSYKLHSKSQSDDAIRLADNLLATYAIKLPVKVICDLGCGTGNNLSTYGNKFQSDVIYAVDPRKDMLDVISPTSDALVVRHQEASAKTFTTDPAHRPTIILTNHVLHWINPEEMPEVLQNIFNQLDDIGGYLAAFYADTKQGLPFQIALDTLKNSEPFKSYFENYRPTQFFHDREAMVGLLRETGFQDIHLDSSPVYKTFADPDALQGFVQQWLPEYNYLKQITPYSGLAEQFLKRLIMNFLVDTNQVNARPISWQEKSFTLLASKPTA